MSAIQEILASEKEILVADKYKIIRRIGGGSYGDVFLGVSIDNGEEVAIKIGKINAHLNLKYENKIYEILQGGVGIPNRRWFGCVKNYNFLVMDRLGPSLEELFNYCSRKFTVQTVLMLSEQILRRVEFIHSRCFIHRDIKPENFLMGIGRHCDKLYMIDFGLAKTFCDIHTGAHIAYREGRGLTGTLRYASINAHLGIEQSRRDDLEAIGYLMMYFLRGSLPWQGTIAFNKKQRCEKISEKKRSTPVDVLCKGYPIEFSLYLHYCRSLHFEETPDYKYLRQLFRMLCHTMNLKCDMFDWTIHRQSMIDAAQQSPPNEPNFQLL